MRLISLISCFVFASLSFGQDFKLDFANAKIKFHFKGEKVDGVLSGLKALVSINKERLELSEISGSVDVSTISTGNNMRDKHLKSDDYFDAAKFPLITFKAKSIVKSGENYSVVGLFKIKNIEREENFILTINKGTLIFKGSINSADYGIMKKKKREESQVDITIEIPFL